MNDAPLENRGRGECRVPAAPAASCAMVVVAHECSHHGRTGTPGIPARNGFNGFLRALPGDRACLSPSSALLLADLTPASRRQAHTTSPSASARFVKRAARVHRIPPRVRDDRDTPLQGDETAKLLNLIWVRREWKYFCKWDWTGQITLIRFNKLSPVREGWLASSLSLSSGTHSRDPLASCNDG